MSLLGHIGSGLSKGISRELSRPRPDDFVKRLGVVFRDAREAAGLSQKRLAEAAGVARTGILMFERGDRIPTIFVCKAVASALGKPLHTLVAEAERKS